MTAPSASDSIALKFATLLGRIAPERQAFSTAKVRAADIATRLEREFAVSRKATVGSYFRDTAVKRHSDVDLFVSIRREDLRRGGAYTSSTTVLGRVRDCLRGRYRATEIGRDGVAITVHFQGGEAPVDVVPGWYHGPLAGAHPVYNIPDGRGDWMPTSPDGQQAWFSDVNGRSRGQLARVVQLLKWWTYDRATPVPLSSFHLEIVTGTAGIGVGPTRYSAAVVQALRLLAGRNGAAALDPLGVSRPIALANTPAKVASALTSIRYAAEHATAAIFAEQAGRLAEAHRQWRMVFTDFPA
jgi:predicted nucleotidyltransferase